MKTPAAQILVFKTDIGCSADEKQARHLLDALPDIQRWTLDSEDIDRVLRIESAGLAPEAVVETLCAAGFLCAELED